LNNPILFEYKPKGKLKTNKNKQLKLKLAKCITTRYRGVDDNDQISIIISEPLSQREYFNKALKE